MKHQPCLSCTAVQDDVSLERKLRPSKKIYMFSVPARFHFFFFFFILKKKKIHLQRQQFFAKTGGGGNLLQKPLLWPQKPWNDMIEQWKIKT